MKSIRIKASIAAFLTILMVSYFASMTLCLHTHEVDGVMMMHSHPYQSQAHSHTNAQLAFIAQINHFDAFIQLSSDFIAPTFSLLGERLISIVSNIFSVCVEFSSLRAPPIA